MTDALQALYDYTLESRFSAFLQGQNYRDAAELFSRRLDALCQLLPQERRNELDQLCYTLYAQRDLELQAMFQAAWHVAREL